MSEQTTSTQNLNANSIRKMDVIIMSVSAAAPAMCLGGSFGTIMQGAGSAVALSFLLATIVIVIIGINYGQLSAKYNSAGGTYSYVRSVFGEQAGFISGWVYMIVNLCTGVIGAIFATYLHALFPIIPLWLGVFILLIPIFFVGWNGIEMTTKALVIVWVLQMLLLIIPAVKIITMRAGEVDQIVLNSMNAFVPSYGTRGLMLGVLVCVWAFVGFECPAYMGEELIGGNKAVKFSMIVSAIAIGLVYVVVCYLWTFGMTADQIDVIQQSPTTLVDYAKLVGYYYGDILITLATLLSCVGCFFAFSTSTPRCLYDMGRTGYLPTAFSKVNAHQTPYVSLIAYSIAWSIVAMYGAYVNADILFTFMALFASVSYIFICLANMKDSWHTKGASALLMSKVLPVISILILLYMIFSSDTLSLSITIGWIVAVVLVSFAWIKTRK